MEKTKQRVVVIGASPKPHRYSNRAVALLIEHGHEVIPVNPAAKVIHGIPVVKHITDITGHVDTVTLYVSAAVSNSIHQDLQRLHPDRVIFNPGSENPALRRALESTGIATEEACTLVLLKTNQFDKFQRKLESDESPARNTQRLKAKTERTASRL